MPFLEEFLYRGIFVRILSLKNNAFISIVLPSLLFSVGHIKTEQLIAAFVFGVILGLIYYKTRNLTICVAMHALANLILYFSTDNILKSAP